MKTEIRNFPGRRSGRHGPIWENICLNVQEINAGEERFREEAVRGCGALGHGPKSDAKC